MDLKEYYLQNVKETDYHYRFRKTIQNSNVTYNIFTEYEETNDYQLLRKQSELV